MRAPRRAAWLSALALVYVPVAAQGEPRERAAQDGALDPERDAFVEVAGAEESYWVGQPFRLALRLGFTQPLLDALVQQHRQRVDVPVRVAAPWLDALEGAQRLDANGDAEPSAGVRQSLILGDRRGQATRIEERVAGGRRFVVFEIAQRYLGTEAGELRVPAARAHFAYGTAFRDDPFQGRVAVEQHEAAVDAAARVVRILPLPDDGRPPAFGGAVGSFTIRAEATPRELALGESLKLAVVIEGAGNLAFFEPPLLTGEAAGAFHVRGMIEDLAARRRTITYDLAPLTASAPATPAVTLAFFDPAPPPRYTTITAEPIAITVRPGPGGEQAIQAPRVAGAGDASASSEPFDLKPRAALPADRGGLSAYWIVLALLGPWVLAFGVYRARRARAAAPGRAATEASAAFARLREELAGDDTRPGHALAAYLAARLGVPPPAVMPPGLTRRLRDAGVPEVLAQRAESLLDALVAARYGGAPRPQSAAEAEALAAELERTFEAAA